MTTPTPRKIRWNDPRLPASFWRQAIQRGGHWLWTGGLFDNGYGRVKQRGKTWRVHRLVHSFAESLHGSVLHTCDVRHCFKPGHTYQGTHADNMNDRQSRERQARGEQSRHKLSAATVTRIRDLYATGQYRQVDLAQQFGIHQTMVSAITRRKSWRHQDMPDPTKD